MTPAPPAEYSIRGLSIVVGLLITLAIGLGLIVAGGTYWPRYQACQAQEQSTGIGVTWSPWAGCHATIFGTDLKVGD